MSPSSEGPQHPNPIGDSLAGRDQALRAAVSGVPAYVKRARLLERAIEQLHDDLAAERTRRLGVLLFRVARLWIAGRDRWIDALAAECARHPRWESLAVRPVRWILPWQRAALRREVRAFNRRWAQFLERCPLEGVHEQQRAYNRWFPIERELALRAAPASSFEPIPLLERAEVVARHPALPES